MLLCAVCAIEKGLRLIRTTHYEKTVPVCLLCGAAMTTIENRTDEEQAGGGKCYYTYLYYVHSLLLNGALISPTPAFAISQPRFFQESAFRNRLRQNGGGGNRCFFIQLPAVNLTLQLLSRRESDVVVVGGRELFAQNGDV